MSGQDVTQGRSQPIRRQIDWREEELEGGTVQTATSGHIIHFTMTQKSINDVLPLKGSRSFHFYEIKSLSVDAYCVCCHWSADIQTCQSVISLSVIMKYLGCRSCF